MRVVSRISLGGENPPWEKKEDDSSDVQDTDTTESEGVDNSRFATLEERNEIYSMVQRVHDRTDRIFKLSNLNRQISSRGVNVSQWCTTSNRTVGDYERLAKVLGLTLLQLWSAKYLTKKKIADVRKAVATWGV